MLNLNDTEEILAILMRWRLYWALFILPTGDTINHFRGKGQIQRKKETEAKVKTLIEYLDAKKELIDALNQVKKKKEIRKINIYL